jgi:hypothetical protein
METKQKEKIQSKMRVFLLPLSLSCPLAVIVVVVGDAASIGFSEIKSNAVSETNNNVAVRRHAASSGGSGFESPELHLQHLH